MSIEKSIVGLDGELVSDQTLLSQSTNLQPELCTELEKLYSSDDEFDQILLSDLRTSATNFRNAKCEILKKKIYLVSSVTIVMLADSYLWNINSMIYPHANENNAQTVLAVNTSNAVCVAFICLYLSYFFAKKIRKQGNENKSLESRMNYFLNILDLDDEPQVKDLKSVKVANIIYDFFEQKTQDEEIQRADENFLAEEERKAQVIKKLIELSKSATNSVEIPPDQNRSNLYKFEKDQ